VEESGVDDKDLVEVFKTRNNKASGFGLCRRAGPFVEEGNEHQDITGD
jgi:hypothetical protein